VDFFDENISTSQAKDAGLGSFSYDDELAAFDEAYNPDDFSQADMNFATAMGRQTGGFGDDNTAQAIANYIAQPQVGLSRSNIRGMANYDPAFAAALDIRQGLDPTHNFQGTGGLTVPSYLRPQIEGERGPLAPKYFSEGERFLQETLPKITENVGIVPFASKMFNSIVEPLKSGMDYVKNSTAGLSLKDIKDNLVQNVTDANVSGFNLSDVINSVKAGITNLFDYPKPVQDAVSNMTESAFITPPSMSEDFGVTRPISFMDDTLNTGIASINPTAMAEATASMPEKRVEIADLPITTNAYKDLGFGIKAVNNEEKLPVEQRNVINAPEFLYTKRGLADPEYDVNPITNPFVDLKTIRAGGSGEPLKFSI
tara:strand:- start:1550 stop:2659 length:1110 start_codon:yes stop_codon:yes gene_type:complete